MIDECCFFAVTETYFTKEMKKNGCQVVQMYKKIPMPLKLIRKIHSKLNIPGFGIWLNSAPQNVKDKKVCIVYASEYSAKYVENLRKQTDAPIFFWYNNIVLTDGKFHDNVQIKDFIPTSFDIDDCERYTMFYNTQYYFSSISLSKEPILYDVVCICKDKGRAKKLALLERYLNNMGLKTYFHICEDSTSAKESEFEYKPQIPYEEVLRLIAQSRILVDFTQENQKGITLRPLEAIFFRRKLITNNASIRDEEFYNDDNFFVIDMDNLNINESFIESPYKDMDKRIIDYYDFKAWLERFEKYTEEKTK